MTCTMCTQGILGSSFTRSLNGVPIALSSEPVLQYPLLWLYGYFSLACIHVGYLLQSNQIRAFFWIYDFLAWRTASAAAYHCTFNPRFPNLISLSHYIYDHICPYQHHLEHHLYQTIKNARLEPVPHGGYGAPRYRRVLSHQTLGNAYSHSQFSFR